MGGCCASPRADTVSEGKIRDLPSANGGARGSFDDEAFYDCDVDIDEEEYTALPAPGWRQTEESCDAAASPATVGGPPHPCEPLDEDSHLPPLPPGYGVPAEERERAVVAMRAAVLGGPDTARVSPWEDRSPATLERFLRARDYDVAVAASLFLDHRAWRQSFGWRVQAAQVTAFEFGQHKICLQARSVDDRPLLIIVVRRHTVIGRDMGVVKAYIVHTMDRIFDSMRPGSQFLVLVDFKGMGRSNIDLKALIACFEILQKYYVERVKHLWFVEPPMIFWAVWKAVQPFVAPKTREKIVFLYGPEVAQTMRQHFKEEDIPVEYGGTGEHRPLSPAPCIWETLPGAPRRRRY